MILFEVITDTETAKVLTEFESYAEQTLVVLDYVGTFVFALSGAIAAVRVRLDLFGVLVLSFAAAAAGGIVRDLLIGAVPPAAISDWHYLALALAAGLAVFFWRPEQSDRIYRRRNLVLLFDGAGLAVFAVAGTQKALGFGLHPVMAALLGMLTGIGGGMLRDLLIVQIPTVLRSELYAIAALAGAVVVVAGHLLGAQPTITAVIGVIVCFSIRLFAIRRRWSLPVAPLPERKVTPLDPADTADAKTVIDDKNT